MPRDHTDKIIIDRCCPTNPLSLRARVGVRGSKRHNILISFSPHPALLPQGEGTLRLAISCPQNIPWSAMRHHTGSCAVTEQSLWDSSDNWFKGLPTLQVSRPHDQILFPCLAYSSVVEMGFQVERTRSLHMTTNPQNAWMCARLSGILVQLSG